MTAFEAIALFRANHNRRRNGAQSRRAKLNRREQMSGTNFIGVELLLQHAQDLSVDLSCLEHSKQFCASGSDPIQRAA